MDPQVTKKPGRKRLVFLILVGLLIVAATAGFWTLRNADSGPGFLSAKVERGDIIKTISATGTLQALITVQVGSQVSGRISDLFADYNSIVHKGQLVARLDPATFEAQLEQARANLSSAKAGVATAESSIRNAEANLVAAQAAQERTEVAMKDAQRVLEQTLQLEKSGVISQRDVEAAQAAAKEAAAQHRQATAQVGQAQAQLVSSKSQLNQAKAQVEQVTAAVHLASVNLSHTVITAPIDGVVIARNVDVGQTVAASLQAPTLFLIANDLTKMQVLANIDEADVGQINRESRVNFTVDAYPNEKFHGQISEIRLNPQTIQNVVTYTAVIDVDNPDLKLKPGMTANVTVTVAERRNVLKVPNSALRFRPAGWAAERNRANGSSPRRFERPGSDTEGPGTPRRSAPGQTERGTRWQRAANGDTPPRRMMPVPANGRPGQHTQGASLSGWSRSPSPTFRRQVVWVLSEDEQLRPVPVVLGITDGVFSELVRGNLNENEQLVTGQLIGASNTGPARSPFNRGFGRGVRGRR